MPGLNIISDEAIIRIMRRALLLLSSILLVTAVPVTFADGASTEIGKDIYEISVDPTDEEQGKLIIEGTFTPPDDLGLLEQVTVRLESNITEYRDGDPTGRYWHSIIYFDEGPQTATSIFNRNDGPADFKVELDPQLHDPQTDLEIPVPAGLSIDVWGELEVTASMTGAREDTIKDRCEIFPEEYYLINLTTGSPTSEVEAGKILNYSLSLENGGNMPASVFVTVPILDELEAEGWNTSINRTEAGGLDPGDVKKIRLLMVAPDEIGRSETKYISINYETAEKMESGDPFYSGELEITLDLKQSSVIQPGDDDTGDDDTEDQNGDTDDGGGTEYLAGIIAAVVIIGGILAILLFFIIRGGGGDDEEEYDPGSEARASMFRM